jgi:hypothetical protein
LLIGYGVAYLVEALRYKPEGAGSIPDGVTIFFIWPNPSSRTMALGSTRPLTEMSTRNLPGGKGRPARKADNLTSASTACYKDSFTFFLLKLYTDVSTNIFTTALRRNLIFLPERRSNYKKFYT